MKIKDGMQAEFEAWVTANIADPYSLGVVNFARRWADLMEAEMRASGEPIHDYLSRRAEDASDEADSDGITGFMYGCAVKALAHFWEHGGALNDWHNAQYGVPAGENGTVNPAILTLVEQ